MTKTDRRAATPTSVEGKATHRKKRVVGRLAPSPTGLLHLGHARSFLLAWWHVRARGGKVVLRIEDLDQVRAREDLIDVTLRDLEWLGLDWDGPVYRQSEGLAELRDTAARLEQSGQAYACVCSRADIARAQQAPQAGETETRYPGTCRGRYTSLAHAQSTTGKAAALRFSVPPGELSLRDGFIGEYTVDVRAAVGDFPITRRDLTPAYQLAVVVDDERQGVTEILRGDDLLSSTPRQWLLSDALGLTHPATYHVPLVLDEQGRRLAKRKSSRGLAELRERGVDARAVVAWIARHSGMRIDGRVRARELVGAFELARVPKVPVQIGPGDWSALEDAR